MASADDLHIEVVYSPAERVVSQTTVLLPAGSCVRDAARVAGSEPPHPHYG